MQETGNTPTLVKGDILRHHVVFIVCIDNAITDRLLSECSEDTVEVECR